jgi:hypothetical protein
MKDDHQPGGSRISVNQFLKYCRNQAEARGIERPVVFAFSPQSSHARAVYTALTQQQQMPSAPTPRAEDEGFGPVETAAPAEAARLLLRHADAAGALAANYIEDPVLQADWWFVGLLQDALVLTCWSGGEQIAGGRWAYDQVSRSMQPPTKMAADDGPCMTTLASGGDRLFEVFGRTGLDVAGAGILVALASDFPGFTDIPDPLNGDRPVRARVTRELVRGFLANVYRDQPHQVAEAVRSLQKGEPAKADWLLRVMRNEPGLLELYRAVRFELAGEEGA